MYAELAYLCTPYICFRILPFNKGGHQRNRTNPITQVAGDGELNGTSTLKIIPTGRTTSAGAQGDLVQGEVLGTPASRMTSRGEPHAGASRRRPKGRGPATISPSIQP